jgi:hypothetical protein
MVKDKGIKKTRFCKETDRQVKAGGSGLEEKRYGNGSL